MDVIIWQIQRSQKIDRTQNRKRSCATPCNTHLDTQPGSSCPLDDETPNVDIELTQEVSKEDAAFALASLSGANIATYQDYINVYTDDSLQANGLTGVGVFVADKVNAQNDTTVAARITDNTTIYAGKLTAIRLTLKILKRRQLSGTQDQKAAIFSDSLSALKSFQHGKSTSRPNLYNEAMQTIQELHTEITLIWIPSHVGLPGNEKVDRLANEAA
jgi:ribonuclease HI